MRTVFKTILLLIAVFTASCRFDLNKGDKVLAKTKDPKMAFIKVTEKPADSLLIGVWEVDTFTYKYLESVVNIQESKVLLTLKKEGVLISENLPNFSADNLYIPDSLTSNYDGTWKTIQSYKKDRWQLELKFDWKGGMRYGFVGRYDIYKRNDSLFLWRSIGDPDSGNRLMFKRVQ